MLLALAGVLFVDADEVAAEGRTASLAPLVACGVPEVQVSAHLDLDEARVVAQTTIRIRNCSTAPLTGIPILMPAAAFTQPPADLDDRNFSWRFPRGISLGSCEILGVRITEGPDLAGEEAGPCAPIQDLELSKPLEPGESLTLVLDSRIGIPERFGSFGAARHMITMRGAWHPTVPLLERGGFRFGVGSGPSWMDVQVEPSADTMILLGDRLQEAGSGRAATWTGYVNEPLVLVASQELRRVEISEGPRRAVLITRDPPSEPRDPYAPGELFQVRWHRARLAGIRRVLEGLRTQISDAPVVLVEVPLGEQLAVPGAKLVLISDALYQISPAEILLRYHDAALTAALITASMRRVREDMPPWNALVHGAMLRGIFSRRDEDLGAVGRITRKGEFLSAIDQFGTDAQIPQEDLFFQRVQSRNPYGNEPEFCGSDLPSPWAAHRMLRELLAARRLEGDPLPLSPAGVSLEDMAGPRWAEDLRAWVARGHREPRSLRVSVSTRGRSGSRVEATCEGQGCSLPVRVMVETRDRGKEHMVWDTSVSPRAWEIPGRLQRAVVDPGGNMLQTGENQVQDPRFDDSSRQDLKWIFARPWIGFTSGERIPTAYVELDLQRRHDLRSTWVLQPRLFPTRAEVLLGHRWGFGTLARPNRNRWQLTLGVKGAVGFEGGGSFSPALKALIYYDSRRAIFSPFRGGWAYGYAEGYPGDTDRGWRASARFGLGGARLLGTRPDWVLAIRGFVDSRVGETPAWEGLQVGGAMGVRGLAVADFSPKHRLAASAELRWTPCRNMRLSLGKAIFLRAIQLVLFTDAAVMSEDANRWFTEAALYQSAGLGLRLHVDLFGLFPAVLAIDEAAILPLYGKHLDLGTLVYFSQAF